MNVYNISETQENTMVKDKGVFMTAREVNMEIEMLKTVFDIVRLVDVSRTAPVNMGSDDCSYEVEHKCFAVME